jgi:hypothetical protein
MIRRNQQRTFKPKQSANKVCVLYCIALAPNPIASLLLNFPNFICYHDLIFRLVLHSVHVRLTNFQGRTNACTYVLHHPVFYLLLVLVGERTSAINGWIKFVLWISLHYYHHRLLLPRRIVTIIPRSCFLQFAPNGLHLELKSTHTFFSHPFFSFRHAAVFPCRHSATFLQHPNSQGWLRLFNGAKLGTARKKSQITFRLCRFPAIRRLCNFLINS